MGSAAIPRPARLVWREACYGTEWAVAQAGRPRRGYYVRRNAGHWERQRRGAAGLCGAFRLARTDQARRTRLPSARSRTLVPPHRHYLCGPRRSRSAGAPHPFDAIPRILSAAEWADLPDRARRAVFHRSAGALVDGFARGPYRHSAAALRPARVSGDKRRAAAGLYLKLSLQPN